MRGAATGFAAAVLALGLALGQGPAAAAAVDESNAQVVFGFVEAVDLEARTLQVEGGTYRVPENVEGLDDLEAGDPVAVYYRGGSEAVRLVTEMELQ